MLKRCERKDAALHRKLILDTARQLFDAQGVESVSMHQIAKKAGIGQGTLYRRYSNKGDLCMDLLQESFAVFINQIEAALYEMREDTVYSKVRRMLSDWFDFLADKITWINTLKTSTMRVEDHSKFFNSAPFEHMNRQLRSLLEEAAQNGELHISDPKYAAFYTLASMKPEAFIYLHQEVGLSIEELKARYITHHLESLFIHQ